MFNLQKRINGQDEDRQYRNKHSAMREHLLAQEVREIDTALKGHRSCRIEFPQTPALHVMVLTIRPQEGFYMGGTYKFLINVPLEYNTVPPRVRCLTRVWHPNITVDGAICLSLLRENAVDDLGWRPTRNMLQVIYGLQSLFGELIDFEDAINVEAAKQHSASPQAFHQTVREYIMRYAQ